MIRVICIREDTLLPRAEHAILNNGPWDVVYGPKWVGALVPEGVIFTWTRRTYDRIVRDQTKEVVWI